ncbi:hypothetical protein HDV05_003748 [Chytridiales sp. JEL 0842]|nr:hypothetical protein HDV05_003748 [Chytridiales sp. JEL 0842]
MASADGQPLYHCVAKFIRRLDVKSAVLEALYDQALAAGKLPELTKENRPSPHKIECRPLPGEDSVEDIKFELDSATTGSTPSLASAIQTLSPFESPLKFTPRVKGPDGNSPILIAEEDCAVMLIEIVGFSKLTTSLVQRGPSGTELIHGTWGLHPGPHRARQVQEAILCGIQLLTELADFNIDPTVFTAGSIPEYKSQDAGNLDFSGTGGSGAGATPDVHEAPSPLAVTQLRLKLALDAGTINNVILGTEDRMEYSLSGHVIDRISELIGSVGELHIRASLWSVIEASCTSVASNISNMNETTVSFSRYHAGTARRSRTFNQKSKGRNNSQNRGNNGAYKRKTTPSSDIGGSSGASRSSWRRAPIMRRLSEGSEENNPSAGAEGSAAESDLTEEPLEAGDDVKDAYVESDEMWERALDAFVSPCLKNEMHRSAICQSSSVQFNSCVFIGVDIVAPLDELQQVVMIAATLAAKHKGTFHMCFTFNNLQGALCFFSQESTQLDQKDIAKTALTFAFEARLSLTQKGIASMISLASGDFYTSLLGNLIRSDTMVVGAVLNRAMKLLALPESFNRILLDDASYETLNAEAAASSDFQLSMLGKYMIKGAIKGMVIYEAKVLNTPPAIVQRPFNPAYVFGHKADRTSINASVTKWATDLAQQSPATAYVLEGTTGVGKSLILREIAFRKPSNVVICQSSVASESTLALPYYCLSFVLRDALKSYAGGVTDDLDMISKAIKQAGLDANEEPFLAYALNVKHPKEGIVKSFSPKDRSDMVDATIYKLLSVSAKSHKFLILVDNYQWIDSRSASLLHRLVRDVSQVFVVISTRPLTAGRKQSLDKLLHLPRVSHARLGTLNEADVADMVISQWGGVSSGVKKIESTIAPMLHKVSGGDAVFCDLLGTVLRTRSNVRHQTNGGNNNSGGNSGYETKRMTVMTIPGMTDTHGTQSQDPATQSEDQPSPLVLEDDGMLRLRRWPPLDLNGVTIADLVIGFFERASANMKRILVVTSALGQTFKVEDICSALEERPTPAEVLKWIQEDTSGLLVVDASSGKKITQIPVEQIEFRFRASQLAERIYDNIPFLNRQSLHSRVAAYFQSQYDKTKDPKLLSRIAFHFEKAKDIQSTLTALEELVNYCVSGNMLDETQVALSKLIGFLEAGWGKFGEESRGSFYCLLGETYLAENKPDTAQERLEQALRLVRAGFPKGNLFLGFSHWIEMGKAKGQLKKQQVPSTLEAKQLIDRLSESAKGTPNPASTEMKSTAMTSSICAAKSMSHLQICPIASTNSTLYSFFVVSGLNMIFAHGTSAEKARHASVAAIMLQKRLGSPMVKRPSDPLSRCIHVALSGLSDQPLDSPLRMEVAFAVGQVLYRDGYLKEAGDAMRTCMRLATMYDRLDIWVKAATLLLTLSTFAGQMEEQSYLSSIDSRIQLFLMDALEVKSTLQQQQLQQDIDGFMLVFAMVKLMSGDISYAFTCIDYVRNKNKQPSFSDADSTMSGNNNVKSSKTSLHTKSRNTVSPAPVKELGSVKTATTEAAATTVTTTLPVSDAKRLWPSAGLHICFYAANLLHATLRKNKALVTTILANVCNQATVQSLKKSWESGQDDIGLGLGLLTLALGTIIWALQGGADDPKCDPMVTKKASKDIKSMKAFCASGKHGFHIWGGPAASGVVVLLLDAAAFALESKRDKTSIESAISSKVNSVDIQGVDGGKSVAFLKALCDAISGGDVTSVKEKFTAAGMEYLHRALQS